MSTQCWYCRGHIQLGATICPHCRSPINPGGGPVSSEFQTAANAWIIGGLLVWLVCWLIYKAVTISWMWLVSLVS